MPATAGAGKAESRSVDLSPGSRDLRTGAVICSSSSYSLAGSWRWKQSQGLNHPRCDKRACVVNSQGPDPKLTFFLKRPYSLDSLVFTKETWSYKSVISEKFSAFKTVRQKITKRVRAESGDTLIVSFQAPPRWKWKNTERKPSGDAVLPGGTQELGSGTASLGTMRTEHRLLGLAISEAMLLGSLQSNSDKIGRDHISLIQIVWSIACPLKMSYILTKICHYLVIKNAFVCIILIKPHGSLRDSKVIKYLCSEELETLR